MRKTLLSIILLSVLSAPVTAEGIGMSPASEELGTIQRGESKEITVYISTRGYEEPFSMTPSYGKPLTESIFEDTGQIEPKSYSGQDISSWVSFKRETVPLDPTDPIEVDGRKFAGNVTYRIDVPTDAEPGYHAGVINLDFIEEDSRDGFGASFVAQGLYTFTFKVPGTAYRDIKYNTRVLRTGVNELSVVNRFVNQGTVTASISNAEFNVTHVGGNLSKQGAVGNHRIPKGESTTVVTELRSSNVSAGNYRVEGTADFMTGKATASDTFSLSDIVEVEPGELEGTSGPTGSFDNQSLPLWLVVMILVVFGVLMYSFGIEPVWILTAVGIAGISLYIIFSSVPNLMLLVLLTVTGGLIYYGVM